MALFWVCAKMVVKVLNVKGFRKKGEISEQKTESLLFTIKVQIFLTGFQTGKEMKMLHGYFNNCFPNYSIIENV